MPRPSRISAACALAALIGAASAHLEPGSLSSPAAGQAYAAGAQVKITWVQAEWHYGKYALDFSRNGGETWESIAVWTGPSGDGATVNYTWTVPDAPGTRTRVRVCQIQECGEAEYRLVSGDFAITSGSAVRPERGGTAPSLRLSSTRNLEVSFSLERPGTVRLEAFDAAGSRLATLLEGSQAAGSHAFALESEALRGQGPVLLRLLLDGKAHAELAVPAR